MVRSQLSDPVPLPPVHVSHGNSTPTSVTLIVDQFPCGCPGVPIPGSHPSPHIYKLSQDAFGPCIWAPFSSQHDWEITCWAKMCGPTSSALVELLAIPKVCTCLLLLFQVTKAVWKVVDDHCLSYSTPKALNGIIDDLLPSYPPFQCQELVIGDDTLKFYFHDLLKCIWMLWGILSSHVTWFLCLSTLFQS
jgi:hypothetical protein